MNEGRPPALDRREILGLAALTVAGAPAMAQAETPPPDPTEIVRLWPGLPPCARSPLPHEEIIDRIKTSGFQDRFVHHIGTPLMHVVRPARPNGAAILIAPGGAYIREVLDKEGFETARRMAEAGVTAFVLRYRLPSEGWDHGPDVPLQDAQRAMRLIRAHAGAYGLDPQRLAMIGFSAGGHLAASLATRFDAQVYAPVDAADSLSARPDLSVLMYPVIDMAPPFAHKGSREALLGPAPTAQMEAAYSPQLHVTPRTPPTFICDAWDDPAVPTENTLGYLAALRRAKVPAEAHIFEEGGHGFGIRLAQGKPAAAWPDLLLAWSARHGFLRSA